MSQCAKNSLINKFQFTELNKKVSYTHPYLSWSESIFKNKNLVQNDSPAVIVSWQGAFIDEMFEAMIEANGVGLAGPQAGISKRIFVVIADDEKLICDGIRSVIEADLPELTITHIFEDGAMLYEYLESHQPDIIISVNGHMSAIWDGTILFIIIPLIQNVIGGTP